ncbi:class I SAM-dependent methyltransferase [Acidocella sp.]|uniref:class I SAM-dependent methyltransferase n=1 Tax=Acidocella sp. TaxID=50710 RepID=UPI002F3F2081
MVACGACRGTQFAPFFQAREWTQSGRYLASAQSAISAEPIKLLTEYCRQCGLIRQVPGAEVRLDYTGISRDTAKQLPDYAHRVIASMAELGVGADDLVVEIGANDGTFLRAMREAGYKNLIGVEPSKDLAVRAAGSGFTIMNEYFGRSLASRMVSQYGAPRAIICRHTLEHVPDIQDMTEGMAALLAPQGVAFIEVPDTDWVISELFAHEIWDEHVTYFRSGSLVTLLQNSGLVPLRMERARFRDTRNLLAWSVRAPASADTPPALLDDITTAADLADFQARWDRFAANLRAAVAAAPRPLVAVGAAHIQLNFLNYTGLDGDVDMLVDDDPVKAGHYAPLAFAVPIRTTTQVLETVRAGTVLRTAFPYPGWEDRICSALAPYGVDSIKPYNFK